MNKFLYILIVILFFGAFGPLANMIAVFLVYPDLLPPVPTTSDASSVMTRMGQMGDFFGGHTAAFSGLLSACVIIHFSLQQLKIAKQTADLTSISKNYDHYNEKYASHGQGQSKILSGIAQGHRRWAIRESFSIIDPDNALETERSKQVNADFEQLVVLSGAPENTTNYPSIAVLCGSLLLDKRLNKHKRMALWTLYEVLRKDAAALEDPGSQGSQTIASSLRRIYRRFGKGFSW